MQLSSWRVSNVAFFSAEVKKKGWKDTQDWVAASKNNPKSLELVFSLCCSAGIDAALVKKNNFLFVRSEKSQNESSPNFSNFCPEFCPEFLSEFPPNFSRSFRASFRGKRRPEKIHQKSPPFFNAKFPGNHEKNIHKMFFWRGGKNEFSIRRPTHHRE